MARRRYQKGTLEWRDGLFYGRYYDRVILPDGTEGKVRRSEPLGEQSTEKMAWRAFAPILAKVNSTCYHPLRVANWAQFSEQWKETMLNNYKPSVQASIKSQLKALAWFDKHKMSDIDPHSIQRFLAQSKGAPKTARNHIALMRSMWRQAKAWNFVQHAPFSDVVLPKVEREEEPSYSVHDVRRIIAAAKPPYDLAFWTMAETGIRRGELCGLDVGDADCIGAMIVVRHSRWGKHITSTKSRKKRELPMSDLLAAALKEYVGTRSKTDPLFLTTGFAGKGGGCRIHPDNLNKRVLKPILAKLGLAGACHAFRHGNITEMGRQRISPAVMQQRVGHADFQTTLGYMHAMSDDSRAAANALGRLYAMPEPAGEA